MWKKDRPQASIDIFRNHFVPFPSRKEGGKCSEWLHNMRQLRHPKCTGRRGDVGTPECKAVWEVFHLIKTETQITFFFSNWQSHSAVIPPRPLPPLPPPPQSGVVRWPREKASQLQVGSTPVPVSGLGHASLPGKHGILFPFTFHFIEGCD